jgi:hypothetical protein
MTAITLIKHSAGVHFCSILCYTSNCVPVFRQNALWHPQSGPTFPFSIGCFLLVRAFVNLFFWWAIHMLENAIAKNLLLSGITQISHYLAIFLVTSNFFGDHSK